MLHCVVTFDEKWENISNLVISYRVIIGTKMLGKCGLSKKLNLYINNLIRGQK